MTKHYEQRKKANAEYLAKQDEIKVRVTKGKKDEYKELAKSQDKSLNKLIVDLLEDFKAKKGL